MKLKSLLLTAILGRAILGSALLSTSLSYAGWVEKGQSDGSTCWNNPLKGNALCISNSGSIVMSGTTFNYPQSMGDTQVVFENVPLNGVQTFWRYAPVSGNVTRVQAMVTSGAQLAVNTKLWATISGTTISYASGGTLQGLPINMYGTANASAFSIGMPALISVATNNQVRQGQLISIAPDSASATSAASFGTVIVTIQ